MMEDILKDILVELKMLRKMKMHNLVESGYSQAKLGGMLGVSQATVSRMMAGRNVAEKSGNRGDDDGNG